MNPAAAGDELLHAPRSLRSPRARSPLRSSAHRAPVRHDRSLTRRRSGSGRRPSGAGRAGRTCVRRMTASRPMRLSSSRGMSWTLESSITTECSISLLRISHPAPIAVNGPMKLSTIRVPAPMAIGPRNVELTISAPPSTTTRPSIVEASSTRAVEPGLDLLEQEAVGLQQRRQLAGVDPPAGEQLRAHAVAGRDQPLDRIGDLQLAAWRRGDRPHGLVDRRVEQVDADEREVRRRIDRLLDERHDVTVCRRGWRCRSGAGPGPASAGSAPPAGRRPPAPPRTPPRTRRGPARAGCRRGT